MVLPPLPTPPPDALVLLHEWEQQRHHVAETRDDPADFDMPSLGQGDDLLWEDDDADGTSDSLDQHTDSPTSFTDPDAIRNPTLERRHRHVAARVPNLMLLSRHPALVEGSVRSHTGVLVARRNYGRNGEVDVFLERMGFATRIGMRLLFHGLDRGHFVRSRHVEELLKAWSDREGRRYDDPTNATRKIIAFIRTYRIDCSELAEPDLARYPTLNTFFYRRLRKDARPVAEPKDPFVVSSAADCRLTVFRSVHEAHKLWIKGRHFNLSELLQDVQLAQELHGGSVAIFRLAPEDYHRYHTPVAGKMGATWHIPGSYYTVNSMIVRDKRFDVFTANKRDDAFLQCRYSKASIRLPVSPSESRLCKSALCSSLPFDKPPTSDKP